MRIVLIFLWIIIAVLVIGLKTYIWRSLDAIRREATHTNAYSERQLYKRSQPLIIGGLLGSLAGFIIVYIWLYNMHISYQILLCITGLIIGLLIGGVISKLKE